MLCHHILCCCPSAWCLASLRFDYLACMHSMHSTGFETARAGAHRAPPRRARSIQPCQSRPSRPSVPCRGSPVPRRVKAGATLPHPTLNSASLNSACTAPNRAQERTSAALPLRSSRLIRSVAPLLPRCSLHLKHRVPAPAPLLPSSLCPPCQAPVALPQRGRRGAAAGGRCGSSGRRTGPSGPLAGGAAGSAAGRDRGEPGECLLLLCCAVLCCAVL